mgnify:FL=1
MGASGGCTAADVAGQRHLCGHALRGIRLENGHGCAARADIRRSLANSALGCGSDKSLSDISQELVNATNDLNAELNGPQWDFFRDHSRFGSDITAAREMLASVDTLVNGPFTDLLNLSKRLQGFSLKNGSVDVSA